MGIAVFLFLAFALVGFVIIRLDFINAIALGAVASFCYLNTIELPSKVTECDKAVIHIVYLVNVIIIIGYTIFSIMSSKNYGARDYH